MYYYLPLVISHLSGGSTADLLSTGSGRQSDGSHEIRLICAQYYSRFQAALPGAPLSPIAFQ